MKSSNREGGRGGGGGRTHPKRTGGVIAQFRKHPMSSSIVSIAPSIDAFMILDILKCHATITIAT